MTTHGSTAMIDNGQFEVRKPVLWFRAIGETIPDGPSDLVQNSTTVYQSTLARPGDRFYLVDGTLVHEGRDGVLSVGALTLRGNLRNNVREAFVLTRNDELSLKSILNKPVRVPEIPAERFPSTHCGVVREDVSPALAELMDATEAFRHDCDQDGGWAVNCSDIGLERTVSLYVLDIETQISLVQIEVASNARTAKVSVADKEFGPTLIGALRDAGIPASDDGVVQGVVWDRDAWSSVQASLSQLFFRQSSANTMAMAV